MLSMVSMIKRWVLMHASTMVLDYLPDWEGFGEENMDNVRRNHRGNSIHFDRSCCTGWYCRYGSAFSVMVRLNHWLSWKGLEGIPLRDGYPMRLWTRMMIARSYAGTRCFCHPCANCLMEWVPDHVSVYLAMNQVEQSVASVTRARNRPAICVECMQDPPTAGLGITEWMHSISRYSVRKNWAKLRFKFKINRFLFWWYGVTVMKHCGPTGKYRKRDREAFEADGEEGA